MQQKEEFSCDLVDTLASIINNLRRHSTFLDSSSIWRFFQDDIKDLQNLLLLLDAKLTTPTHYGA